MSNRTTASKTRFVSGRSISSDVKLPDAADGSWRGLLHLLSPTADFLRLCRDIRDWADKHPDETLLTEKFGSYSRSQSSSAWEKVFERRLRPYLRMFPEVKG